MPPIHVSETSAHFTQPVYDSATDVTRGTLLVAQLVEALRYKPDGRKFQFPLRRIHTYHAAPMPFPCHAVLLKADSHIACRAHAVPLPCRAAKGLECVFPI
jgi:hypothetical protein